jgi:hypothetical protein
MENNYITLEQYEKEVEEQNKFLLNEMAKHNPNSEIYKLRCLQYQSNLKCMEKNKDLGYVLFGPQIII